MRVLAAAIVAVAAGAVLGPARAADPVPPRHGVAMHGEPKYPAGFKHFDYINTDAPKGGTIRLAAIGSFDSLNAFIVRGEVAAGITGIYDTLMSNAADEAFTEYGLLAESVEMPEDRSWVAFNLRPEARWHDGRPVTADDVVFTFETLREKGSPAFRYYYHSVDKAERTSERRVKFTFKPGDNRELPLILGQFQILPKHYWETRDFSRTTLEPPLGSGPYRIERVDPGRSITYRRVPDYWGRSIPVNVGADNYDVMQFDYYRDETVALEAFKAGAFDFRVENSAKNWATAYDIPAVRRGVIVKAEIKHQRAAGMQGFVFNTRREMFKDRRVRQALGYAFDFEWSNKNLFNGQYKRTRSYFDNSELAATGLPGGDELAILEPFRGRLPDEVFAQEYNPPRTDGSGQIRDNLRAGDSLLKEAGWMIRGGRRVNAETGQPLTFEVLLVTPLFERIVLPFARNLERLGVGVGVRTVDTAQYQRRTDTYDFDVVVATWGQSLSPGNEQRNYWSSTAAADEGGRNLAGIRDPVVDALIDAVIAAPDRRQLVMRTRALDRVLQWGFYVVPHYHLDFDRLAFWDKFGRPSVTPITGFQFNAWWIDPGKAASLEGRKGAVGGN